MDASEYSQLLQFGISLKGRRKNSDIDPVF